MTTDKTKNFFRVSAEDFKKIPGSPIAYWLPNGIRDLLSDKDTLGRKYDIGNGLSTSDNERFLRFLWEVSAKRIGTMISDNKKWFLFQKGGAFRRWYGNLEYVVNWENDGAEIKYWVTHNPSDPDTTSWSRRIFNTHLYFKKGFTWSVISSGKISFRVTDESSMISNAAAGIFNVDEDNEELIFAAINTRLWGDLFSILNPTVNYSAGIIQKAPLPKLKSQQSVQAFPCVKISKNDWDSYETSWDFQSNPLIAEYNSGKWVKQTPIWSIYDSVRRKWAEDCEKMRQLEMSNNRIFIDAYGLHELTSDVPWDEITLTCNPWYRYGKTLDKSSTSTILNTSAVTGEKSQLQVIDNVYSICECSSNGIATTEAYPALSANFPYNKELEDRLLSDTIKEFISYAVGCMMGRYSPEKPGLIFAGGEFSDQWSVISGQLVRNEEAEKYVREELSRVTGLAEEYGVGDDCVSTDKTSAEGRNICVGKSDAQSSSLNSIQYCRGTSQKLYEGIRELSLDSKGLQCGSGNPTYDLCSPEILDAISNRNGSELMRRGWQDAERIDWQAIHKAVISGQWSVTSKQGAVGSDQQRADHHSLTTNHLKPKTAHWPLTTNHYHPDRDGVLPILDEEWFSDDIVTQFKAFVALTFGEENLTTNMDFIESVLGKDIRKYFVKDFYKEHIQRYKKRPIYWLFSSPKGSFNALIYLHRYTPDTVSIVLNEYLRELMTKLSTRIKHLIEENNRADISNADKTRNLKQIDKYTAQLAELEDYERDVIFPLAQQKIAIDLDDGVKVNYCKFGAALKKITGLEAKEE